MSQRKRVRIDENSPLPHTPAPLKRHSSSFVNTFGTPLTNTPLQTPTQPSFLFVDAFTPVPKRRKVRQVATEDLPSPRNVVMARDAATETRREEETKAVEEQGNKWPLDDLKEKKEEDRLNQALKHIENVEFIGSIMINPSQPLW